MLAGQGQLGGGPHEPELASEGSDALEDGRRSLEAAAGDVLSAPELERTVDKALAGSLPDAVALARRASRRRTGRRRNRLLPEFEDAIAAALDHEVARRLADRAIASSLSAEVTDRVLDGAEAQRIVEHVASSPEVRVAMTRRRRRSRTTWSTASAAAPSRSTTRHRVGPAPGSDGPRRFREDRTPASLRARSRSA